MKPKKRNLESLWALVQKFEGLQNACLNFKAGSTDKEIQGRFQLMADTYKECGSDLARALARLERKGKG